MKQMPEHSPSFLAPIAPVNSDDPIDLEIKRCLNPSEPKSFILFAGAGSGKTRSLKVALEEFEKHYGQTFTSAQKSIAVITYTNEAVDNIKERVGDKPIFPISTIHSFCWEMIRGFDSDIQSWMKATIPAELEETLFAEKKGRKNTKASSDRIRKIARLREKLEWLKTPRKFTYNPNGQNFGMATLAHSEVLKIFSEFVVQKTTLQSILVNKHPFILIDESQDTNKHVLNALLEVERKNSSLFALGLFGDTMQKIYGDGDATLGHTIPEGWVSLDKKMNHRSASRIVGLGNAIRSEIDQKTQCSRADKPEGFVRFFLCNTENIDKIETEKKVAEKMAEITKDEAWIDLNKNVKRLTLEHKMAARRGGFYEMYDALSNESKYREGLGKGDVTEINYFRNTVLPLTNAITQNKIFDEMSSLIKYKSPLLEIEVLNAGSEKPFEKAQNAVDELSTVAMKDHCKFADILEIVNKTKILPIPQSLRFFVGEELAPGISKMFENLELDIDVGENEDMNSDPDKNTAIRDFLETDFDQISAYADYVDGNASFGTHQGVKGREFERVMAVMDDQEAGGFLFSYGKYLASEAKTSDQNERTARLFYVISTRAEKSLAHVIYASNLTTVKETLISRGFCSENEIVFMN